MIVDVLGCQREASRRRVQWRVTWGCPRDITQDNNRGKVSTYVVPSLSTSVGCRPCPISDLGPERGVFVSRGPPVTVAPRLLPEGSRIDESKGRRSSPKTLHEVGTVSGDRDGGLPGSRVCHGRKGEGGGGAPSTRFYNSLCVFVTDRLLLLLYKTPTTRRKGETISRGSGVPPSPRVKRGTG